MQIQLVPAEEYEIISTSFDTISAQKDSVTSSVYTYTNFPSSQNVNQNFQLSYSSELTNSFQLVASSEVGLLVMI